MEEVINNIMQSPENTNPNVLRSQLQNIGGGSGGGAGVVFATFTKSGDVWTCDKTFTELKNAYENGAVVFAIPSSVIFGMLPNENQTLVMKPKHVEMGETAYDMFRANGAFNFGTSGGQALFAYYEITFMDGFVLVQETPFQVQISN